MAEFLGVIALLSSLDHHSLAAGVAARQHDDYLSVLDAKMDRSVQ